MCHSGIQTELRRYMISAIDIWYTIFVHRMYSHFFFAFRKQISKPISLLWFIIPENLSRNRFAYDAIYEMNLIYPTSLQWFGILYEDWDTLALLNRFRLLTVETIELPLLFDGSDIFQSTCGNLQLNRSHRSHTRIWYVYCALSFNKTRAKFPFHSMW